MHDGLAITAYDVEFNRNVTENNALFFTTKGQLGENVKKYLIDNSLYNTNKLNVKQIANEKYIWTNIVEQYAKIF